MAKLPYIKNDLYKIIKNNPNKPRREIVQQFVNLGYAERSVYRWISKIEKEKSLERKKGSGRPKKIAISSVIKKMARLFDHKSGCSQNRVARRFHCSQPYVSMILNKYTMIRCRKKIKKPLMTLKQKAEARPKCRKMLERYKNLDFVIDDESYFTNVIPACLVTTYSILLT